MTDLRQRLGPMLVCGFEGDQLPSNIRHLLAEGGIDGVILFARNYTNRTRLKVLTEDVKRCSPLPPFIAVDQEGGRVVRFGGDFPVYPSPRHFRLKNDPDGLLQATRLTAEYLKEAGVNLNLIPVCDLAPDDPTHVIYSRAYSEDPLEAAEVVSRQVVALRECGLLSCAKHFPGLATGLGDPHFGASQSDQPLEAFRRKDYVPFAAAIRAGVDMIMVTHLKAPAIDPDEIATFSETTVCGELKGHLGHDGLVISDDLLMAGSLEKRTPVAAGCAAIAAGCDLLIYGNPSGDMEDVIAGISAEAQSDEKLAQRLAESHARVVDFRQRHIINCDL